MIRAIPATDNSMLPPAPGKRKASDDTNPLNAAIKKRRETTSKPHPVNKRKLTNGEEQTGGLVIVRAPSRSSSSLGDLEHPSFPHDQPPRPSSRQHSQPPEPPTKRVKGNPNSSKGKGRDALLGVREDPQVDEDVRQMESETDHLRRKSRAAEDSAGFADPSFKFPSPNTADPRSTRRHHPIDTIEPKAPQQRKNTLREQGGARSHGRKSSLNMRGKRVSSSYESTGIITQPHTSVSNSSLYKHIDHELPEPQRARQLFMWASHRAMASTSTTSYSRPGKDPPEPLGPDEARILRTVQEKLIKMLADKKIDTNVYSDGNTNGVTSVMKENEQNAKNRAREIDFMARIEQSQAEDQAWTAVSQFYNSYQATVNAEVARRRQSVASAKSKGKQRATAADFDEWDIDDHELPVHFRGSDGVDLARRLISERLSPSEDSRLSKRLQAAEDTIERLYHHTHSAIHTTRAIEDDLNRRFAALNFSLASSNILSSKSGHNLSTEPPHIPLDLSRQPAVDPQEVLRALSRIDVERPPSQIGDSARRAVMEIQRLNESTNGATERKLTGVPPTPRKNPGTPRRVGTPGRR